MYTLLSFNDSKYQLYVMKNVSNFILNTIAHHFEWFLKEELKISAHIDGGPSKSAKRAQTKAVMTFTG